MAKLGDILLPPNLNQQLVATLDLIPDADLLDAPLRGSFTKPSAIKKVLAGMIQSDNPLPDWLEQALTDVLPHRGLLSALDPGIIASLHPLAQILGQDLLLLLLLTDERTEAREYGLSQLNTTPDLDDAMSTEEARGHLNDFFNIVCLDSLGLEAKVTADDIPEEIGEMPFPPAPGDEFPLSELEQLLSESQHQIDELKTALEKQTGYTRDAKKRAQTEARELQEKHHTELQQHNSTVEKLTTELSDAQARINSLQTQLTESSQSSEATTAAEVARRTSAITRKWLADALELETTVRESETSSASLLDRAHSVLETQARIDRNSGNRARLEELLKHLVQTRTQISQALQTAINPHPDLPKISAELDAEIARLHQQLGHGVAADPATERILERINLAANDTELDQLEGLIHVLTDAGMLTPPNRRRLYHSLMRRHSLFQDQAPAKREDSGRNRGGSLRERIQDNRPLHLLIDGHNVMYGLQERLDFHDGNPTTHAMDQLKEAVTRLVRNRSNVQVRLYFDAPDPEATTLLTNVSVDYSGGKGRNRADQRILADLDIRMKEFPGQKFFVVTDDRAIRQEACALGAVYTAVPAFEILLQDSRCLFGPNSPH